MLPKRLLPCLLASAAASLVNVPLAAAQSSDDYYVDGSKIPGVSDKVGDIGHSWSGNVAVTPNGGGSDPS